jgi:hypothetical protein
MTYEITRAGGMEEYKNDHFQATFMLIEYVHKKAGAGGLVQHVTFASFIFLYSFDFALYGKYFNEECSNREITAINLRLDKQVFFFPNLHNKPASTHGGWSHLVCSPKVQKQ